MVAWSQGPAFGDADCTLQRRARASSLLSCVGMAAGVWVGKSVKSGARDRSFFAPWFQASCWPDGPSKAARQALQVLRSLLRREGQAADAARRNGDHPPPPPPPSSPGPMFLL